MGRIWTSDSMIRADFLHSLLGGALAGSGLACADDGAVPPPSPVAGGGALSVRDFGAVGDGVADDTDAIQAAIDAGSSGDDAVGAQVYAPAGTYAVSRPIRAWRHGTALHFDGVLTPFGDYQGFLIRIDGRRQRAKRSNYGQGKLDITRLRIDGRHQSSGLSVEHVDQALLSNILIERTRGVGLSVAVVRESDVVNVSIIGSAGSDPSLLIDQHEGDGSNNVRFYGLNIVYGTNPAIVVDSHARSPSRNLSFFGAQIHYLDRDRGWGPPRDGVVLVDLRRAARCTFVACNMRLAATASGTIMRLGASAEATDIRLVGCTLSGEGNDVVGIEFTRAAGTVITATDFVIPRGRDAAGSAGDATVYGAEGMVLPASPRAPRRPWAGMVALANGGSWDPAQRGGSPYLVRFDGQSWGPLI